MANADTQRHVHDTVIVGAGLSGICAAWHLTRARPDDDLLILESRQAIGGTWDLFRYPGVRSDSDMPTLGFTFRPWIEERSIADGDRIQNYIEETAKAGDLTRRIRFGHHLRSANWCSETQQWVLQVIVNDAPLPSEIRCRFLLLCTGYYRYAQGHLPSFEGIDAFRGTVVHPQHWPEALALKGKRVTVIGSGATAVTLTPALAAAGAKVTMLQRTPSYIAVMQGRDGLSQWLHRVIGARAAHWLTRWKNILATMFTYQLSRRWPRLVRWQLLKHIRQEVGHKLDVDQHFRPPYEPWDQRVCLAPDGDFFEAIKAGQVEMVTDHVDRLTETGVRTVSGTEIASDVVVTATGLSILVAGGAKLSIDGVPVAANERITYKGAMLSGLPNLAITMGYTNASWTLKCELIAQWIVRLRQHMDAHGHTTVEPVYTGSGPFRPFIDLESGYIARAADRLPRQTGTAPWTVNQNYIKDLAAFRWSGIDDGALKFD